MHSNNMDWTRDYDDDEVDLDDRDAERMVRRFRNRRYLRNLIGLLLFIGVPAALIYYRTDADDLRHGLGNTVTRLERQLLPTTEAPSVSSAPLAEGVPAVVPANAPSAPSEPIAAAPSEPLVAAPTVVRAPPSEAVPAAPSTPVAAAPPVPAAVAAPPVAEIQRPVPPTPAVAPPAPAVPPPPVAESRHDGYASMMAQGEQLRRAGDPRRALLSFERAVAMRSSQPEARYAMGVCYLDLQKPQAAKAEFQRALLVDSSYAPALKGLGMALRKMGEEAGAERVLRSYAALVGAGASKLSAPRGLELD